MELGMVGLGLSAFSSLSIMCPTGHCTVSSPELGPGDGGNSPQVVGAGI